MISIRHHLILVNYINYSVNRFFSIKLLDDPKTTFSRFRRDFKYVTKWKYFVDKKLFNDYDKVGYNEEKYETNYSEMKKKMISLVCFLNKYEEVDDGE